MLIDLTYFSGEILIAQRSQLEVQEDLSKLIAKYEKKVLTDLFGKDMYTAFIAGIEEPSPLPKWTNLKNGVAGEWMGLTNADKLSLIANYVYFFYMRKENLQTVGIGTVETKADNAHKSSPVEKYVRAWNEMVDWICELHAYILANASEYPDYENINRSSLCKCSTGYYSGCGCGREELPLFTKINSFGL